MLDYLKREAVHTAFAVALTVLVAVASELAGIKSFQEVSLTGLAVTAVRSLATAVVVLGSRYVIRPQG